MEKWKRVAVSTSPWPVVEVGEHPQFLDRVEDLAVEELVSELGVEAFAVAVFLGRAGFDVQRLGPGVLKPLAQVLGRELGLVVGTKVFRYALPHHYVGQGADQPARFSRAAIRQSESWINGLAFER